MIIMTQISDALKTSLNEIVSYLAWGVCWHGRAAGQLRKLALRGFARWHECEAHCDEEARLCLEKILVDHIQYIPAVDSSKVAKAETYTLNSVSDFKNMFSEWVSHEEAFCDVLNKAIEESRSVNMCLYEKLCCLAHEVQDEIMRAQLCYERLEFAGFNGHDIGVCSMVIHKHFEEHESDLNFNIG